MDNIIEPNNTFDFSKLSLSHPSGVQGGAYFTKLEYNRKPIYIQTPKSLTRQGFVKTGKKYYCDLMFDKNAESLIHWFENLEEKCQKLIFEKREDWFQNTLEEGDIETAFNSLIRVYKSGKYYLVRTNIKTNRLDEPAVKIYNENEAPLTMHDITGETKIISILEIQGIKFTSRNFQIEVELKQVMILDNDPVFESCVIKSSKHTSFAQKDLVNETLERNNLLPIQNDLEKVNNQMDQLETKDDAVLQTNIDDKLESELLEPVDLDVLFVDSVKNDTNVIKEEPEEEKSNDEIKEIDIDVSLSLDNNVESFKLKKPNQVYFEMYKQARKKAKEAKKNAIIAYLEAKNIKKTYMIENMDDSDSEFDAEIDEVSESELEAF
jgi:hypothetical protein